MIRPAFLDNVHAMRTRATVTDAAREACAIERHAAPWCAADLCIAVITVAVLAGITLGVI